MDSSSSDVDPERGDARRRPARRHRTRRGIQAAVTVLGVLLLWGALGLGAYAVSWEEHKDAAQTTLLRAERMSIRHAATHRDPHAAPCVVTAPQTGQLAGVLSIPALQLTAPVEEGTGDTVLNVAVGHAPSSVWPGVAGSAVFLAHDVSYFVHLDALKPGDQIIYRTACTTVRFSVSGSTVVQQGTPIPNSTAPSIVLDTCYPPNALFFTTKRLLITATELSSAATSSGSATGSALAAAQKSANYYTVPAPATLVAQGLTLQQNEAPMGVMTLAGQTTPGWEQSPGPLALEAAALEAYFGGIHATQQLQSSWWTAIADPGVLPPAPLLGAVVTGHDAPLDVEVRSTHDAVTSVVLTTTLTITGGPAPGVYHETVTTSVSGSTVRLASWALALT